MTKRRISIVLLLVLSMNMLMLSCGNQKIMEQPVYGEEQGQRNSKAQRKEQKRARKIKKEAEKEFWKKQSKQVKKRMRKAKKRMRKKGR